MKLVPCEKNLVVDARNARSDAFKLLTEFVESGLECAKIEDWPHKDADNCATSFRNAAKRYGILTVTIVRRGENVYLLRKSV